MLDLVIDVDHFPSALAAVTEAVSSAGVNLAAVTYLGGDGAVELHILVPHEEPVRHALELTHHAQISRVREVAVVEVDDDRPGVLADLAAKVAEAGVDLDLVYVATHNRVVLGSPDLDGLRAALGA